MKSIKTLVAIFMASILLSGCVHSEPQVTETIEPALPLEVAIELDGVPFENDSPIPFTTLTPNQVQVKQFVVKNNDTRDVIVNEVSVDMFGDFEETKDISISVVDAEGAPPSNHIVKSGEEFPFTVTLTTTDSLLPGIQGYIVFNLDVSSHESEKPSSKKKGNDE